MDGLRPGQAPPLVPVDPANNLRNDEDNVNIEGQPRPRGPQPPAYQALLNPQNPLVRNMPGGNFIRSLTPFKSGSDLLIFLQRFAAYCQVLQVPQQFQASLLVSHLDDASFRGIARHLNEDDLTLGEVVDILKKSQGYSRNNLDKHTFQI